MAVSQEASVREVLAEVNVLDLWRAVKMIATQWGCMTIVVAVAAAFAQVLISATGDSEGLGAPDWLSWLFCIWVALGIYTSEQSYHEHRFAWYFPKAGFLWSVPLACYLMVGIQFIRGTSPDAGIGEKTIRFAAAGAWWFPLLLAISVLAIGHGRLMERRLQSQSSD